GGHSLLAVHLVEQIRKELNQEVSIDFLFQYPTIYDFAYNIRQDTGYSRRSVLVPLQKHGLRAPFFCVHAGGGSVFCYLDLVRHLGTDYPFYGLQLPELGEEINVISVEQLATQYLAAMQTIQPEGPYLLGGWSGGGIIAFEIASQLRRQGHDVALLCLFDSHMPFILRKARREYNSSLVELLVESGYNEQEVLQMVEEDQLRAAYDTYKRKLVLPDGLTLTYVQHFVHTHFMLNTALREYNVVPVDQRITLIRVEEVILPRWLNERGI